MNLYSPRKKTETGVFFRDICLTGDAATSRICTSASGFAIAEAAAAAAGENRAVSQKSRKAGEPRSKGAGRRVKGRK
ncbi:hypothetical protein NDU88_008405 [Pleurodeles waltl]|uniref:Uncharacterized protein n=1 Tax=Pleurodeles waltl TaxID=8319 RepID=A0AAV7RS92_PLEWA|nr:hypothetical protein NDU88_008405 [Pleurodeles waltl]